MSGRNGVLAERQAGGKSPTDMHDPEELEEEPEETDEWEEFHQDEADPHRRGQALESGQPLMRRFANQFLISVCLFDWWHVG
jgi:hypothetical protein